jgi:hypothetical protein
MAKCTQAFALECAPASGECAELIFEVSAVCLHSPDHSRPGCSTMRWGLIFSSGLQLCRNTI